MAIDWNKPQEVNPLNNNCFHFEIPDLPKVSGFAQRFNMPGLMLGRARVGTGNVDYDRAGEKLDFEDLEITFLIDENLENFMEIFHWMVYLGFPRHTQQFAKMMAGETAYKEMTDIILTTTTNKYNANKIIHFVDCFPISLTPIEFTNTDTMVTPLIASASFSYSYYYFENSDPTMDQGIDVENDE